MVTHGRVQVKQFSNHIFNVPYKVILLIFDLVYRLDCVDNFDKSVFNFTECVKPFELKCDYDGKCYRNTTTSNGVAICPVKGSDTSNLISLGKLFDGFYKRISMLNCLFFFSKLKAITILFSLHRTIGSRDIKNC